MKEVKATSWYILLDGKMLSRDPHFKHINTWVRAKKVYHWENVQKFRTKASAEMYAHAVLSGQLRPETLMKLQFRKLIFKCQY